MLCLNMREVRYVKHCGNEICHGGCILMKLFTRDLKGALPRQ